MPDLPPLLAEFIAGLWSAMQEPRLWFVFAVSVVGGVVRGYSGFGGALIVVPLLIADAMHRKYPPPATALPRWSAPLGAGLLVLLVVARIALPTVRGDDRVTPMTALAKVPPALRAQPVLNGYDFGGYLIFAGVRPYVDGRTDMYGDAFLANYDSMMSPNRKALTDALARWHIAWSILPPGPAAQMMDTLPGWQRLYSDGDAVVHIRRNPS